MNVPVCNAVISWVGQTATCSGVWSTVSIDNFLPFNPSTLDPISIVSALASGMIIIFPIYAVAWGASFVLSMISGRH